MRMRTFAALSLLVAGAQTADGQQVSERPVADPMASQVIKLARGWIDFAVRGDIVPTSRGAGATRGPTMLVAVTAVTEPQVLAAVTSPSAAAPVTTPTGAVSQTQALLTSGNPASVVVGARLERTRIVGNPGTTGGSTGVRFNTQVRPPLQLGQSR